MAQTQAHAKENLPAETRGRAQVPAVQARGRSAALRDSIGWAGGPFSLMRQLSDDMDQLFGQLMGGNASPGGFALASPIVLAPPVEWMPALEIFERDGKLVVQADLPGVAAGDVTVEVTDGVLTVSGERREEREIEDSGFRRTERRYGKFSRSVALPEGARAEEIQATYRDGVLEITMPLSQPASRRRTIEVQSESSSGNNAGNGGSGARSDQQSGESGGAKASTASAAGSSQSGTS